MPSCYLEGNKNCSVSLVLKPLYISHQFRGILLSISARDSFDMLLRTEHNPEWFTKLSHNLPLFLL